MKRIGILTYHPYNNYGAVLQAYALQTYISNHLKNDVEIIDFCTDEQLLDNGILQLKRKKTVRSLLSCLKEKLPLYYELRKKKKRFEQFRKGYLKLTVRYKDAQSLFENLPSEDIYITGSDQVFNPYAKYTDVYYLGFDKKEAKKVAYAPSFGVSDLEESVNERLISLIYDFDYLSCREEVGATYLSKLLGKNVPCVADPVFLLSKDEWSKVILEPRLNKSLGEGYIFVYRLNGGQQLMELAKMVSSNTGLPIMCVARDKHYCQGHSMDVGAGPSELLGYISGASFVVTDSFHGTALSLVFGVKVIPFIAFQKASSRITTLMNKLDLSQNIIYNVKAFDFNALKFSDYDNKMQKMIAVSKKYLQEALS